jgi:hypothetical protein
MKKEDIDFIIENYGNITRNKIAKLICVTEGQIKYIAKKYDLKSNLQPIRKNVYDNAFSQKTLQNCYWAGFIAADGCISADGKRVKICLGRKDLNHLIKLKEFLKAEREISLSKINSNTYLTVNSPQMVNDLRNNFNIMPQKSLTLESPKNLSYKESLAYIIGYIDGDGTIGINTTKYKYKIYKNLRLRIIGTPLFLEWVNNILKSNAIPVQHCRSKIHIISIGETNKCLKLLKKTIMGNNLPALNRKWDKVVI